MTIQSLSPRGYYPRAGAPGQNPPPPPPPNDRLESFAQGAFQGAAIYGLPAVAGTLLPGGAGLVGGLAAGVGMGLYESRHSSPECKFQSALGGAVIGVCASNLAGHFGWIGAAAIAGLGAAAVGLHDALNH